MWSRGHVRKFLREGKGRKTVVLQGVAGFRISPDGRGCYMLPNKRETALFKSRNRSAEGRNIIYDFAGNCKDFLKVGYSLALEAGYSLALKAGYSLA